MTKLTRFVRAAPEARRLSGLLAAALVVATVSSARASTPFEPPALAAACKPAVIGGKRICLKAGQHCERRLDRQYHRYGFHCHGRKLTKAAGGSPAPSSPPTTPKPRQPAPPGPGQRVDVGGYSLYIECSGSGSPTVVMEQGFMIPGATGDATFPIAGWRAVRASLAADTRACTYDRANLGASDDRPSTATPPSSTLTNELRTLLRNAGVGGPLVLVGASFGGFLSVAHVVNAPSDFAGLVLLDALEPCVAGCSFSGADRVSFDPSVASTPLGDRPLVVVTSGLESVLGGNIGKGPELARRSTNSFWVSTPGSGHGIAETRTQVVIDATRLVVAAVRAGSKLPLCDQTALPSSGGVCER
jgi:hypothetical protein